MIETVIATSSVVVAVVAALASAYFSVRSIQAQSAANRLQYSALRSQYFAEMRQWADAASDALTDAMHLCELDPRQCEPPSLFERRLRIRSQLSSLIDRGRFFFPNRKPGEFGQEKPVAFRGYRHALLDALVAAHDLADAINYLDGKANAELRDKIMRQKRVFISEVQEVLNPWEREAEFEKIMSKG